MRYCRACAASDNPPPQPAALLRLDDLSPDRRRRRGESGLRCRALQTEQPTRWTLWVIGSLALAQAQDGMQEAGRAGTRRRR
jgi:hypothetical protein